MHRAPRVLNPVGVMSIVTIDATGCLVIDGRQVFPIGLSEAPPLGGKTRDGKDAWAEVASAGVNFVRTGLREWSLQEIDNQVASERARMDAAHAHGLHCWPRLGNAGNLPPATPGGQPSVTEQLLVKIANGLRSHPALGAYKGVDEPAWGVFRRRGWPGQERGYARSTRTIRS